MGRPVPGVLAAARDAGIARVITVGTDLESSRWSARCAAEYDDVYAAVAIHPNDTEAAAGGDPARADEVLAEIETLAGLPQVRAVGETGLDYYRDHAGPAVQQDWFRAHIAIAKRTGKALMIHDREAHEDVLRILAEEGAPDRVVFHCFSGDAEMAKRCADAGYVMSFAGNADLLQRAEPARRRRRGPARPGAGRDRRAVPDPGAVAGQAELARPGRLHRALPGAGEGHGRGRALRPGHGDRGAPVRPMVSRWWPGGDPW